MKRREMLAVSGLTVGAMGLTASNGQEKSAAGKEYIELRYYRFKTAEKRKAFVDFMKDAMIPALNKVGISKVGVFENSDAKDLTLYVVLPHKTFESFATSTRKIMADKTYLEAGKAVLGSAKKDPAFERIETNLFISFDACPKLEEPKDKADSRIFQLRIYEAHNTERGHKKIHMFNEGGETALFRKKGLNPVFFGEAIAGTKIPNLTYMVTFKDAETQKAAWKAFISSPEWKTMSKLPIYKDTVSRITNLVLKPTAASQL